MLQDEQGWENTMGADPWAGKTRGVPPTPSREPTTQSGQWLAFSGFYFVCVDPWLWKSEVVEPQAMGCWGQRSDVSEGPAGWLSFLKASLLTKVGIKSLFFIGGARGRTDARGLVTDHFPQSVPSQQERQRICV